MQSSAGTSALGFKRTRTGPSQQQKLSVAHRLAFETEASELLEHQKDSTETIMTGADEDTASWAYGSGYYLQEEYINKLQRHHRSGGSGGGDFATHGGEGATVGSSSTGGGALAASGRAVKRAEVLVNAAMAYPPFFQLGNDFPPVSAPDRKASDAHGGENETDSATTGDSLMAAAVGFMQNASADMDIIMPVVSTTCTLAQSASKGSAALAELKRTMERERINRDVMDTSKSNLTQLLAKDTTGRLADDALQGKKKNGNVLSSLDGSADVMAENDEEEALRRRIRLEQASLDAKDHGISTAKNEETDQGRSAEERDRDRERQLQRKREKQVQIDVDRALLEQTAETEEDEARRAFIRVQQRSLPIYRCREELMRYIGENAVTVVVGETGSGKTTQLVQYLYQDGYARGGMIIGCTQPRRLAAIGVARRVSDEMRCALGTTVGYAIHLDDTTTESTQIKFMTDGVLLREIVQDADVNKYSVIVLDEAHERSVDTDILMGVLKLAIRRRGDLKLIVTSATLNVDKFSRFFGNAPCYEIPGQTFDVHLQYAPSPVVDYVADAVFRVCQLHLQTPLEGKHDILVFMTGRDDVYGTCELIKRKLLELSPQHADTLIVLPCMSEASSLTVGDGSTGTVGVLDETPAGKRKCVVATNVAETSLTIDGVRYVVDCGYMKTNVFRPKIGMNTLQRYPVSQAQANQRKGRAGRTTEGLCFRLYTEEQFTNEMLAASVPEIQRSSVDSVILLLKSIGVRRLVDFDFMDPPPVANTRNSMWHLWVLGLLDNEGCITADGRRALEFPVSPALARLLIEGTQRGCGVEVARVVAVITADPKNLFELPKGKEETAQQHHGRFYTNDSDHLTLLNVLTQFIENGRSRQWAQDHFLHAPTLVRACDVLEQLLERFRRLRLPVESCGPSGHDTVRECVARAFCLQSAQRSGSNWSEYRPLLNVGVVCSMHPSSALCARAEMPQYVIYNDLLLMNKEYIVMVTAVEPEWLVEGSQGLFYMRGTRPTVPVTITSGGNTATAASHTTATAAPSSSSNPSSTGVAKPKPKMGMLSMLGNKRRGNI